MQASPEAQEPTLRLLQATMGHSSITVTAHTYAVRYDDELDAVADALDRLTLSGKDSQRGAGVAQTSPIRDSVDHD